MLAKGKDRQSAIVKAPVLVCEIFGNAREKGTDRDISNVGKCPSSFMRGIRLDWQ